MPWDINDKCTQQGSLLQHHHRIWVKLDRNVAMQPLNYETRVFVRMNWEVYKTEGEVCRGSEILTSCFCTLWSIVTPCPWHDTLCFTSNLHPRLATSINTWILYNLSGILTHRRLMYAQFFVRQDIPSIFGGKPSFSASLPRDHPSPGQMIFRANMCNLGAPSWR